MRDRTSRPVVATDAGPFAIVPLWVVERLNQGSATGAAVSVLVALHRWTNDDRYGFPSHASIAEVAGISVASVKRGIKALEEIGALVVVPRWIGADGEPTDVKPDKGRVERTSNGYFVRYADPERELTLGQKRTHPLGHERTHPLGQIRPSNQTHLEPDPYEPEEEQACEMIYDSLELAIVESPTDDNFDRFWSTYPRKTQKAVAVKRWQNMKRADRLAALDALPAHIEHWRATRTEPQFIPHPATWLYQRRWEDQLTTPQPQTAGLSRAAQTIQEMIRNAADRSTQDRGLPRGTLDRVDR